VFFFRSVFPCSNVTVLPLFSISLIPIMRGTFLLGRCPYATHARMGGTLVLSHLNPNPYEIPFRPGPCVFCLSPLPFLGDPKDYGQRTPFPRVSRIFPPMDQLLTTCFVTLELSLVPDQHSPYFHTSLQSRPSLLFSPASTPPFSFRGSFSDRMLSELGHFLVPLPSLFLPAPGDSKRARYRLSLPLFFAL